MRLKRLYHLWRFPFDWKNLLGYLIAISLECMVISYAMLIGTGTLTFGVASYSYLIASSKCIKGSLFAIGRCTNDKAKQHILDRFIEFMQFHSQAKQLSAKEKWIHKILTSTQNSTQGILVASETAILLAVTSAWRDQNFLVPSKIENNFKIHRIFAEFLFRHF